MSLQESKRLSHSFSDPREVLRVSTFLLFCVLAFLTACTRQNPSPPEPNAEPFIPRNFARFEQMPHHVHRVAILPLWHMDGGDEAYIGEIEDACLQELKATGAFEIVLLNRPQMRQLFGQRQFGSTEPLPTDFLPKIQSTYSADAILFLELTDFDPYRPLRLGLRGKLVDLRTQNLIWAFDEVFNSGDPRVAAGALEYSRMRSLSAYPLDRSGSILQSPQRFAHYAAHMTFRTLPPRLRPAPVNAR